MISDSEMTFNSLNILLKTIEYGFRDPSVRILVVFCFFLKRMAKTYLNSHDVPHKMENPME